MQSHSLHLLRDSSQQAVFGDMGGNSADISEGYFSQAYRQFESPLVRHQVFELQEKTGLAELCRDFRRSAVVVARVGH